MLPAQRILSALSVLALSLLEPSCLFRKEPRKATIIVPPAPQPAPPQPLPAPPTLPPSQNGPSLKTDSQVPQLPAPVEPAPKKRGRPTRRPATSASTQQAPVEPTPAPEAPPVSTPAAPIVPALQPILGNQEIGERNKRIASYLEKARQNVFRAERNRPNAQAAELIAQVKTFLQQAEDARKTDLVRAENLAERAEVLSRGLNR